MTNGAQATAIKTVDDLFAVIPQFTSHRATSGAVWRLWNTAARDAVDTLFRASGVTPIPFGVFGDLVFPYIEMGAINSLDLFGMDELIIFAFYHANRHRYRRVVDFGANIGLHSTILGRCGFEVRSFEPDPVHIGLLEKTLSNNHIKTELHRTAISVEDGEMEFVRVLGNTTGSHLAGAKAAPYGQLERFIVKVESARPHLEWADLAKIDIEGHEASLICSLPPDIWLKTDAVLEVGTAVNAAAIFDYLSTSKVRMMAQKTGWQEVKSLADMPTSHRDGSLFLTSKDQMPW